MTWIDGISIAFALLTIATVVRGGREIKQLLSEARYERLDINRRLEILGRRIDRLDERDGDAGD